MILEIALSVGTGVALGTLIMYFGAVRPLQEHIIRMRKRGFITDVDVPSQNEPERYPGDEVVEF